MSTISIDVRMIDASGIGTYIRNVIPRVIDLFPEYTFNLLGEESKLRSYKEFCKENVRFIECSSSIYSVREQIELPLKIPKDTELYWAPHYNIPIFYRGKLIVTVHDVFHVAMPEYTGGMHKRLYAKAVFFAIKCKANRIICDSQFTANELIRLIGVNPNKIKVIHNGVHFDWFKIKKEIRPHSKPYLIYAGNVKPHKNLGRLLEAFEYLIDKIPHDLIIVGKKEGFITGDKAVQQKAESMNKRVHFMGHIDDNMLKQYFVYADMLVFPSLYEGFGLPPLEAMAAGCPVIVSHAASLPEVCGDAALYFDPHSVEDIKNKILQLVADKELRGELRKKGLEHSARFSWDKAAMEIAKVLDRVVRS